MFKIGKAVDYYDRSFVVYYCGPFSWSVRERELNYVSKDGHGDWTSRTVISLGWTKRPKGR